MREPWLKIYFKTVRSFE